MVDMIVTLLLGLITAWFLWSCLSLFQNYQMAQRIGLPIVVEPVNSLNIGLIIANMLFRTYSSLAYIRAILVRRLMRFSYIGWQFDQGSNISRFGGAFSLVTPGSLQIVVADADAAHDILTRRKDFVKPEKMYKAFDIFGRNLNSVEGQDWQRHRRLTAPSLNESVSDSVWQNSIQQAQDVLQSWKDKQNAISTTASDAATVALNIFTACGFGISTKYGESTMSAGPSDQLSYRDAVRMILRQFPILILLPEWFLGSPFMPHAIRRLQEACQQFRGHINAILNKEKDADNEHSANLLSNLIKASNAEKSDNANIGLTDEEILGNMFIFTLAGHETTANTVATAIFYLARYPTYQSWIREELGNVLGSEKDTDLDYSTSFPRLKRCLALMLETLRVHGSIVFIPRSTTQHHQVLRLNNSTYTIPPDTIITINNHAIQIDSRIWGADAEEWKPDRWIINSEENHARTDSIFGLEQVYDPPSGAFIPWADGPRNCPGKKFSQVEFVAIMATLLRRHKVEPVAEGSKDTVNEKLDQMLRDSGISSITLQVRNPEAVELIWKEIE